MENKERDAAPGNVIFVQRIVSPRLCCVCVELFKMLIFTSWTGVRLPRMMNAETASCQSFVVPTLSEEDDSKHSDLEVV